MSNVRVWVNGRLTGEDEPSIAALDHGVTVGPVPLQDLFIHLTEHPTRTEAHA